MVIFAGMVANRFCIVVWKMWGWVGVNLRMDTTPFEGPLSVDIVLAVGHGFRVEFPYTRRGVREADISTKGGPTC